MAATYDAFVSYARRDQAFVRSLYNSMQQHKQQLWVDWEGIDPTEAWLDKIHQSIEEADAFIFVLSPASVTSFSCNLELAYAMKHRKKIIPILYEDVDGYTLPALLQQTQWILMRISDDNEQGFQQILVALTIDLAQRHQATALLTRARQSQTRSFDASSMLRGKELHDAYRRLRQSEEQGQPLDELATTYIMTSRKVYRRRRTIQYASFSVLLCILLLSSYLVWQRLQPSVTNLSDFGAGSLRSAIASAPPGAIITFDPQMRGTIVLTHGQIILDKDLTIRGPGEHQLAISGNNASRIFLIDKGATISLAELTLKDGNMSLLNGNVNNVGAGGAIKNNGTLTLDNMSIIHNTTNWWVGGIFNDGGTMNINNSTIADNSAPQGGGGGIFNGGTMNIESSTIADNLSRDTGGIDDAAILSISNSTIYHNIVTNGGGGGLHMGEGGSVSITYSTFYGNQAVAGGNLYNLQQFTPVKIWHNIFAGGKAEKGPDIYGAVIPETGYNVIQNGADTIINHPANDTYPNFIGIDPKLGPLQDNGGATPTSALLPGSPVIDIDLEKSCQYDTDQRGISRPQGKGCDSGAYEATD